MADIPNDDFIRRMARAEELKALAARARNSATRLYYLQLAAAFRHLAQAPGARGRGDQAGGPRQTSP